MPRFPTTTLGAWWLDALARASTVASTHSLPLWCDPQQLLHTPHSHHHHHHHQQLHLLTMAQLLSPAELLSTMSVLDNGTNIGTAAHKASISSGQTFSLERRGSSGSQEVIHGMSSMTMTSETVTTPALSRGGSKSGRRGSGSVLTPSGQHVVYHTRTQVCLLMVKVEALLADMFPGRG